MGNLDYKTFYRRHLPHFQPSGATLFVTFRLAGSIPQAVLNRWAVDSQAQQKRMRSGVGQASSLSSAFRQRRFVEYENLLHRAVCGPLWLKDPELATIVSDAMMFRDSETYAVDAYCVMPNHVHVVLAPLVTDSPNLEPTSLGSIMHSVKSYTANQANAVLRRQGSFWEHENFDRAIRDEEEWLRTIGYVLNNPVKAGLVGDWQDWPHSYCRPELAPE